MINCPCKGCLDRHFNCHALCRRYEDFKIEKAAETDFLREQNRDVVSTRAVRTHWRNLRLNKRKYLVNK